MPLSRAELPSEFFDKTSAQLLAQPEPQYLYARWFLDALNIELGIPDAIGMPGRAISGSGADYRSAEADRLVLARMLPENLFAVKADFKGAPGHTFKFNRPMFTDSTYTEAAREIGINQTISVVPIGLGGEQVSLTVKRFGGPYDSTNGRVAPYSLDNFDASMGVHSLSKIIGSHLRRDFHKFYDAVYITLANQGSTTVRPAGMAADNDALVKGQFPLTYEQTNRVHRLMTDAHLPTLPDGRRVMVVTPTGEKQLKEDPLFVAYSKDHRDKNPLIGPGWFASTPEFHFFVNATLTTTANSSSVRIHNGHAIAPGAFMGGVGKPARVAPASDDNYGETAKVIWLSYSAHGIADNRFIYNVKYTEDVAA